MSRLMIDLRDGERLLINGAEIESAYRSRFCIRTQSRLLFGKQIMELDEATTPMRRLYYALQQSYVRDGDERRNGYVEAMRLMASGEDVRLRPVFDLAVDGQLYPAMRLVREMIQQEAATCVLF